MKMGEYNEFDPLNWNFSNMVNTTEQTDAVWRTIVLKNLSLAAICTLMFANFGYAAPDASVGAGNPNPVSEYTCEDGTHLAVRLFGNHVSVSVNGATEVDLPAIGSDGTTYSNGPQTLTIKQGRLSWAIGRAMPSACTGG